MKSLSDRLQSTRTPFKKLAVLSSIPVARLEALKAGEEPSLTELRSLAKAFRISFSQLTDSTQSAAAQILFRNTVGDRGAEHAAIAQSLSWHIGQALQVVGTQDQTPAWLQAFSEPHSTYQDAERNAEEFRAEICNDDHESPLLALPQVASEHLGIILNVLDENLRIDGASAVVERNVFVFVSSRFPPRMLFTLAHELGHLVAHHTTAAKGFASIDESGVVGKFRGKKSDEWFADAFASCLLMPRRGVGLCLQQERELLGVPDKEPLGDLELIFLSRVFGVSFNVAGRRCEDLGLIERGTTISLYERIKKEHKSPEKRGDAAGLPARPPVDFPRLPSRLVKRALEQVRAGGLSAGRAASALGVTVQQLMDANSRMPP